MPAIRALGITKSYGEARALDAADLVVEEGQVHGLLGPNGAGKTTLLRILFGLVRPDAGTVHLLDRPVVNDGGALDGVGGFVEEPCFYPHLSAQVNLEIFARLDDAASRAGISDVLGRVDLLGHRHERVGGFSTGMRQRLGLAAALLRHPRLLMLDEPTSGLDPAGIRDVGALIHELTGAGVAVLLSSHQIAEMDSMCDAVTVLRRGVVVWTGSIERLRAEAPGSSFRLATTDDQRALALAPAVAGAVVTRAERGNLVLVADGESLDRYVRALARADVAVRRLELLVGPLESLFFTLTADAEGADSSAAAQVDRASTVFT